jgi:hypothetical protein
MPVYDIPVKMYGVEVGNAAINDDGSVVMHIVPNDFGADWIPQFEAGTYDGLTIVPSGQPVTPEPV